MKCLSVACLKLTQQLERPRKPKIGTMEAYHMSNLGTYLEVKMSKVRITRPINAVRDNAAYDRQKFLLRKKDSESIWYSIK